MSTDTFEDELRTLLHDTADAEAPAYVDVAPDEVLAQGHRVVRRRRMAAGAGIAAAVVALGAVGAVTLGNGIDRTSEPAATTSAPTATGPVSAEISTTLDGKVAPRADVPVSARVQVDEQTRKWWVTLTDSQGRQTTRPAATLPANPGFSTYIEVGSPPDLVVGVMPAVAKGIVALWLTEPVESSFSSAPLPGTDRQAFAIRYSAAPDPNVAGDTILAGFDWTDGQQVFDSAGAEVPSARDHDDVVFVDRKQDLFGIFGDGNTVSKRLRDTPAGQVPVVMSGRVPEGSDTMVSTVLVVLPAEARGVRATAVPGATLLSTNTVSGLSTSDAMVVLRVRMPKETPGTGIQRLSWLGLDGQRVGTEAGF